jgi:hypothetical protein
MLRRQRVVIISAVVATIIGVSLIVTLAQIAQDIGSQENTQSTDIFAQAFVNATSTQRADTTATQQAFVNMTSTQRANATTTQQTFVNATSTQRTDATTTQQDPSPTYTPTRIVITNTPYSTPWILITNQNTNIRQYPYSISAIIGSLPIDEAITVVDLVEGEEIFGSNMWYLVEFEDQEGYIHQSLLNTDN